MKKINRAARLLIVALVALMSTLPAAAEFGIGPRIGTNVNSLKFNRDVFDTDNRAGFNAGLMIEFTAPIIGIGFDLSAMYVHRGERAFFDAASEVISNVNTANDNIEIPLNLKWKLGLPIVKPFVTTGPSVSFLCSKKAISEAYHNKTVDFAWNFGFGLEFLSHLQVSASYGMGLTKALSYVGIGDGGSQIEGKNRYWTITAAYLF